MTACKTVTYTLDAYSIGTGNDDTAICSGRVVLWHRHTRWRNLRMWASYFTTMFSLVY